MSDELVASRFDTPFEPIHLDKDDERTPPPLFDLSELSTRLSLLVLAGVTETQALSEIIGRRTVDVASMLNNVAFRNRLDYVRKRLTSNENRSADWAIHTRIRDGIMPNGEAAPPPIMYAASKDVVARTDPPPAPVRAEQDDPSVHIHISGAMLEQLGAGLAELSRNKQAIDVSE